LGPNQEETKQGLHSGIENVEGNFDVGNIAQFFQFWIEAGIIDVCVMKYEYELS